MTSCAQTIFRARRQPLPGNGTIQWRGARIRHSCFV